MTLTPVVRKFVLHWGEMGTRWGVNRTVAQIHALLYLFPQPLHAEDIAATLSVARSSVSTSLRELQSWGLVRVVHMLGDRRDHFESMTDVWEMFRVVLEERKRREIDPTRGMLRECVAELAGGDGSTVAAATRQRLVHMLEFFEAMTACYEQMRRLPTSALIRFVKMGSKVRKVLGITS